MGTTGEKVATVSIVGLGLVVVVVGIIVGASLIHGFTIMLLWNWFIPDAIGFPRLSLASAIGLGLLVSAVRGYKHTDSEHPVRDAIIALGVHPASLLVVGFIVKGFL